MILLPELESVSETYFSRYGGVINLTTVLKAPTVATNGHYWNVRPEFGRDYYESEVYDEHHEEVEP